MSTRSLMLTLVVFTTLGGVSCGERTTGGGTGGRDAGRVDAGGGTAGSDAGPGRTDAGSGTNADAGPSGSDAGTGNTTDAGSGTNTDAGSSGGAPQTIAGAKGVTFPALVDLRGVVVTAVPFARASGTTGANCPDSTTKGVNASFWVADPSAMHQGIWVTKYRCDAPYDYLPVVGDVLNLKGFIGIESSYDGREWQRFVVKQQYDFINPNPPTCNAANSCQPLDITKTGTMALPPDAVVGAEFGNDGGYRANGTYAGSRVKIAAGLTIRDAYPLALKRDSMLPGDNRYFGFQLSNGVLVNNYLTFATFAADGGPLEDGGTSSCDFRLVAVDGGTVNFASVSGVWDTYSFNPCRDGGVATDCPRVRGYVPGTDGGTYTYVLYPTSCADFALQ